MRLTVILLLAVCMQTSAEDVYSQITLSERNTPFSEVVKKIQTQSGYDFVSTYQTLQKAGNVSINVRNVSLQKALEECLKDKPLTYSIIGKTVVLKVQPGKMLEEKQDISTLFLLPVLQKEIRGRVTDENGNPLQGVSVTLKGNPTVGTTTNEGGDYSLTVGEDDKTLVFSSVGFLTQEVQITEKLLINVVMKSSLGELGEVVVTTALGIRRSEKSLTYSVQELPSEEVVRNKDANFVNSLSGKIAGVSINPSSSGIGGATRVVMRGTKSISGNNNVLYVIDGIPIPNVNGGSDATGPFQGVVSGEGISSINPEDIESISALTGPAASALYGNQGANGVIIVTTKKGTSGDMKVNISHSSDFFRPFVLPKFQNTYGQSDPAQFQSWGNKLATPSSYDPEDFFETGYNVFNAISLSGGTEKSQTFFSLATNNAAGIIPNNRFNRYNAFLRQSTNFNDRFSIDFNVMYIKSNDKNMVAQGQYHNPLLGVYLFPPNDDIRKYQIYSRYDPDRKIPMQFWPYLNMGLAIENPYWITNSESVINNIDRYALSAVVKYDVFDWLSITGRARVDNSNTLTEEKRAAGTDGLFASEFGYFTTFKSESKSTYLDVMASINQDISRSLKFNSNIGGSYIDDRLDGLGAGGKLSRLANFYSVSENTVAPPTQSYDHQQLQSVFATAEFEYDRWLFLNMTGRYEWPSQLPKGFASKTSYFYPSIGLSGVFTDALNMNSGVLSFGKLRMSYAEVGNPPGFGVANPVYSLINPDAFRPAPFPEYLPERTKSYELGTELKFFHNNLNLSVTLYKSNTTNQLMNQKLETGELFTDFYYNAGNIENKGIEATLGYQKRWGDLSWNSTAVFTLNRNKVIRLSEGYTNPITNEMYGKDSIRNNTVGDDLLNILTVNGSMADLYITQVLREDNQGNLWVDPSSGSIAKTTIQPRYIGRTTPSYNIGWNNSISFKNLDLSFLVDARVGGIGISYTQAIMDAFGVSEQSAIDRDAGGSLALGKRYPNVQAFYDMLGKASGGSVGMAAYYVYSATNVRLREASLSYLIPTGTLLGGKIHDLKVALTGRNLIMFYNKSPFDPESTSSTGTYYQGIDYFRQPSYRSFGFSIKAQF